MADKVTTDDKILAQEGVVGVEAWDEDKRKLDKRVNRKLDTRIMPWLIIRSVALSSSCVRSIVHSS